MESGVSHEASVTAVLIWYDDHARELPWRDPSASAWSVLVSEFMLQQTPVARVLPAHEQWLQRWPTPADLANDTPGEAVRLWGRLGYPRRALRLHATATALVNSHGGQVPASYTALVALPGVGDYTAAAVASFAFGQRQVVLDTNVRRVLTRWRTGKEFPGASSPTRAERELAESVLPTAPATAATWSVAVMELGALVCTAARPSCGQCPISGACRWREAGFPAHDGVPRTAQTWAGTDRQCRGRLLAAVREAEGPVSRQRLDLVWHDHHQRQRCLTSLLVDGLLTEPAPAVFSLPT
ncbi:MAG: A/G-specific adenine glycosylase [Nocardioides sp.]